MLVLILFYDFNQFINFFPYPFDHLRLFPHITRPIRLSDDSNTLIDNIFTNNFCKPHLAGILFTPVSDDLIQFCIIKGRLRHPISNSPKCIEVENLNPLPINNFRHAILKSNINEKLEKIQNPIQIKITNDNDNEFFI